jgi:two-component system, cell cycle sensor histidine kinase and response regulator CckA
MHAPTHGLPTRTILLVDDDRVVRFIAFRILEEAGYGVVQAGDGVEALTYFLADPSRFDALVTDVIMPRIPGTLLASRVHAARPTLPVLLMSGYTPTEMLDRGVEAPHTSIVPKPFDADQLLTAVRRLFGEPGADEPPRQVSPAR